MIAEDESTSMVDSSIDPTPVDYDADNNLMRTLPYSYQCDDFNIVDMDKQLYTIELGENLAYKAIKVLQMITFATPNRNGMIKRQSS